MVRHSLYSAAQCTAPVSESLKLPRAAEVVAKERGGCARNFPSSDVTSAAFVSSFIPRIDQSAEWEPESRLTRDPRDRRGVCEERERESGRGFVSSTSSAGAPTQPPLAVT